MPFIGLSKPSQQILKPMPEVGKKVPASNWLELEEINVVAFLRHTGCPFAEQMMKHLSGLAMLYPEISIVAVTHGNKEVTEAWLKDFKLASSLKIIFDEARAEYGEWGVGYSSLKQFLNPMMTVNLLKLLGQGIHNRNASGTRWQQQVVFLIDEQGILRYRHLPKHAGDVPDLGPELAKF